MKYEWLNEEARTFLERGYLPVGVTPEQRIRKIAETAEKYLGIEGYADKFESYMEKGWFSLSSPVWANYGNERGLPVSCNGSFIPDTMEGILYKTSEVGMMTKLGAGTSAYFGALRPRGSAISIGGTSNGPVHFMELFDLVTSIVSQSSVRRGTFAAYLPIDHADILEFLQIRGEGHPIQDLSIGVCISDEWMESLLSGDKAKRKIWAKVIEKRFSSGYPYIFFNDTANRQKHQVYKDQDYTIYASNVCSEINLPSNDFISFVCVLSSLNLLHYDDWKDTDAVEVLTYFLDTVTTEYIVKTEGVQFMDDPRRFAKEHRAIGIGVLGWHSYLQSRMIPFESMEANFKNSEIFKLINQRSLKASQELAQKFGEPEILKGYGERMTARMAVAPTKSSSFILGQVSEGIEPLNSNYFVNRVAKGNFTYKNPFLKRVLKAIGKNTNEVWKSILQKGGSVQHLDFLSDNEKAVFKTFGEISQKAIIIQAASRQKHIDQSQSLNLMIPPDTKPKDVSDLIIEAWRLGVKSLYYQKSANPAQQLARNILECAACEA